MSNCTERVRLSFHAKELKNAAGAFKGVSDPYAVVTQIANEIGAKPRILGKTEVIKNNLSPHWVKYFEVEYDFSTETRINVNIFDEIRKSEHDKSMGSAFFEVGTILGSRGNIQGKKLKQGGTIFCRVEKLPKEASRYFHFQLIGVKMKNVDGFFGKSDPFFEISKLIAADGYANRQIIYRSEVIMNDLNPKWKAVSISLNDFCDDRRDQNLLFTFKDWEKNGKHQPLGIFEASVNDILNKAGTSISQNFRQNNPSGEFKILHKNKIYGRAKVVEALIEGETVDAKMNAFSNSNTNIFPGKVGNIGPQPTPSIVPLAVPVSSGGISINALEPLSPPIIVSPNSASFSSIVPLPPPVSIAPTVLSRSSRPTFMDYLSGGLQLQLSVAIDFTGSNGDPRKPGTLHYINRRGDFNDYEKALTAVGSIIAKYDSDQMFPILGFGAKYGGVIRHCFQLGLTPEVSGIKGMLDAYRNTFQSGLTMSGPTVFAEVIQLVAARARKAQEAARQIGSQAYEILLILTDGSVTNVETTKQAIAAASDSPLSIVIVGIGEADFSAMQFLDDFQNNEVGGRDICQFVEFSIHKHNKRSLTAATLEEIPDQVVEYFSANRIKPIPSVRGSQISVLPEEYKEEEQITVELDFDKEGEINLSGGGVYDDTEYGNYSTFAEAKPMSPPPVAGSTVYTPQLANNPASFSGLQYSQNPAQMPTNYGQPSNYSRNSPIGYDSYGRPSSQPVTVTATPVFQVQVPQGVTPGQRIQIHHPRNGQLMIVTVPPGVPVGGIFSIPY